MAKTFYISIFIGVMLLPSLLLAQDDEKPTFPLETIYAKRKPNTIRKVLKHIKFGLSVGAANTFMAHKLDGFGVLQGSGFPPFIFPADSTGSTYPLYSNWVNTIQTGQQTILPDSYLVSSDTAQLKFKANAFNVPVHLTVHYETEKFRIGGGYGIEFMSMGTFKPKTFSDNIDNFKTTDPAGFMKKYYGYAGYSFYRWNNILFTGVFQLGGYKPGNNFASGFITKSLNANLGVVMERNLSENFGVFVKPSFDIKSYRMNLPGSGGRSIKHNMNALYFQFGVTYSIPELPRCFHRECKIQMNHAHGNKEYRSRVHPFYKKQNPHYGENHPELIKYKGKNKKKLNPY